MTKVRPRLRIALAGTVLTLAVAALLAVVTTVESWAKAPMMGDDKPLMPVVVSPEVRADRTIVFRLYAPKASEVDLFEVWSGQVRPLTKDGDGVWSITVGPYEPELYTYQFRVDGVPTPDPINPRVKLGRTFIQNLVDVKGERPRAYDLRLVPHGTLHVLRYESASLDGAAREMVVYTPPGYDQRAARQYPVLYLLHGTGEDENTWTGVGLAHRTLDNLLADGKIVPMIVVMPDGHAFDWHASGDPTTNTRAFEADLLKDIIPLVERTFQAAPGPNNRAIAGLSMGGGQAFAIGTAHPAVFAHVCAFSMGRGNAAELAERLDREVLNRELKLFWVGCGQQDHLYEGSAQVAEVLTARGIRHVWHISDGAHNWITWRKYLAEVAPVLFR